MTQVTLWFEEPNDAEDWLRCMQVTIDADARPRPGVGHEVTLGWRTDDEITLVPGDRLITALVVAIDGGPFPRPTSVSLRGLYPWYEQLWDRFVDRWRCHVLRKHRVKFGSRGHCVACGRKVGWQ